MKKIGLYGGTFDPIHFGHLNAAIEIQEKIGLDEIWFCPAYINPHKESSKQPSASSKHRLEMLELALAELPAFKIIDYEIARKETSYTYITLQEILSKNLDDQFYLIIGEDVVPGFFNWFEPEKIVQMVPIIVASRTLSVNMSLLQGNTLICEALRKGWTPIRIMDISSTYIRNRLKNKLYCGHLIPYKTLCYIFKNLLYFNS